MVGEESPESGECYSFRLPPAILPSRREPKTLLYTPDIHRLSLFEEGGARKSSI
jgi:hypothetical protein